jgi:hypothetical protein
MKVLGLRLLTLRRDWSPVICTLTNHLTALQGLAVLLLITSTSFQFHSDSTKSVSLVQQPLAWVPDTSFSSAFLQVGEELRYRVSYWFFGLGEIKVRLSDKFQEQGKTRYRAEAWIDSYSGNPFVNLHEVYESEFDSALTAYHFEGRWLTDDVWHYVTYDFDYDSNRVLIQRGRYDSLKVERYDTIGIDRPYQDGLSLLYFARAYVGNGSKMIVPTFIKEKKGKTYFDFSIETDDEEIDSVSYPIDVLKFKGEANWVGVFGLTGGFEGEFSNDGARIPIVARMKVIIGSVKLKLQDWKRGGWIAPRHIDRD